MSLYESTIPQMKKMLNNLAGWLDKAAEHAKAKSFDPNVYATSRLAPDQYPLVRQVQSACDAAKFLYARLAGKEAPKHPDTEQTFDEIRARVRTALAYLDGAKPADFAGAETRSIDLPFMEGKAMSAADYANELSLPNFYFHVTHAYGILRHNGVPLGKMDYIGSMNLKDR